MLTRERKTEIETVLIEVLQDFGLAIYPMSINRIADALDIELIPHSSLTPRIRELAISASEDGFSLSSPDYAFAQIVFDDRGSYYYRARFSGGHEIGHIVLEHPENGGACGRKVGDGLPTPAAVRAPRGIASGSSSPATP